MRIVAGEYKGRRLAAPRGHATRPTADRVREGLFSALAARLGPGLGGGNVLDAYAGSGALGLEALSRGATRATFVDKDGHAVRAMRSNIDSLGVRTRATVIEADVRSIAKRGGVPGAPFSLLFLDPPYRIEQPEVKALIEALARSDGLTEGAIIVWEHDAGTPVDWPQGVEDLFDLRYGSTKLDAGTYQRGATE